MADTKAYLGAVILEDQVVDPGLVVTEGDRIAWVGSNSDLPDQWADTEVVEVDGYIMPGLVDVHCHGGGGASFPDSESLDDVRTAANEHLKHGTTTLIASLVTAAIPVLEEKGSLLAEAADRGIIAGFHYEGPFIAKEKAGAQNPKYIVPPTPADVEKLLKAARGQAYTMTIAPEKFLDEDGRKSLRTLIEGNVLPSWGHTIATVAQTNEAIAWGETYLEEQPKQVRGGKGTITHLFNGMPPMHHRNPGPIPASIRAAADGTVVAELINDGIHLDAGLVAEVVRTIGRENCVFVTDAMAAAGMADGQYVLGPQEVRVEDGVARLVHGDALAGGTSHLVEQIKVGVEQGGLPLVDCVYLASRAGANILGLEDVGRLTPGASADLLLTTEDFEVISVVKGGQKVT